MHLLRKQGRANCLLRDEPEQCDRSAKGFEAIWLDREPPGTAVAELLKPSVDEDFEAMPVTTRVNSPKNDDCDCIAPLAE